MNTQAAIQSLLKKTEPQDVDSASVERSETLVRTLKEVEVLRLELNREIDDLVRPVQQELKQHRRLLERMFCSVLPDKKTHKPQEKFAHIGLKNWMADYVQTWRNAGLTGSVTLEQLRKSVGNYNRRQFEKRLVDLQEIGLLRRNEVNEFVVGNLPTEAAQ